MMSSKKELRSHFRFVRKNMSEKDRKDLDILNRLKESSIYSQSKTFFVYVSSEIEVDTRRLIKGLLDDRKTVAVPLCDTDNCLMDFYEIRTFSELSEGAYGILEPDCTVCRKAAFDENTVCIVPGLSFDKNGYRLGFGKGYYDRFLSHFSGTSIGLCYEECMCEKLICDKHDKRVSAVVTENKFIMIGENYGRAHI